MATPIHRAIITSLFVAAVLASIVGCAFNCERAAPVNDFDVGAFMGKWYELASNPTKYDVTINCVRYNATLSDGDTIEMAVDAQNIYSGDLVKFEVHLSHTAGSFNVASFKVRVLEFDYDDILYADVVHVDYASHAIFHGCDYKRELEYVWILGRERALQSDKLLQFHELLKKKGIDSKHVVAIDQEDCKN